MPGMLDTILNVGLDDVTLRGLLRTTGDPTFVWDSYRRFDPDLRRSRRRMPVRAVRCRDRGGAGPRRASPRSTSSTSPPCGWSSIASWSSTARSRVSRSRRIRWSTCASAVESVLRSWSAPRAVDYRRLAKLDDRAGTAVIVQSMVFGNMGMESGSGVGFTRDPATGEDRLYVDFLLNAQGEDIVAGRHAAGDADRAHRGGPGPRPPAPARPRATGSALPRRPGLRVHGRERRVVDAADT